MTEENEESKEVPVKEEEEEDEANDTVEPSFSQDILRLKHSFGYDCKRLYNLWLIDDDTLVFASGNFLHYYKLSTDEVTFRETVNGAGIGFLTKNLCSDYDGMLTVGENGKRPIVFVYKFPSHEIVVKLEGAAKNSFTCGSYNSTGELLATQAGYPDFMLTIWRWERAEVMLRSKSFQNDVLFVHFSAYNPDLLVSCGLSHIKFWKMANTFTGLKLQGDLGRFGKTDFSDIYSVCMMADENVISGCEWGNMLLWEAGLIKLEVCRKGRLPCHLKPITSITYDGGEVMTVGMDGFVRIWYWETVDLADPPDDDRFVEIEPINEFYIPGCEIRSIQKIKPHNNDDHGYFAQDGNGGIWFCDLNPSELAPKPQKLYSCHGGKIITGQLSPVSKHLITMGEEGKLLLYDYMEKKLLLEKSFKSIGTDMLWFNTVISSNGMEIVASFEDGVIRQFFLDLSTTKGTPKLILVRAIKAHTAALTKLSVNPRNAILVSSSADRTVFLYTLTDKQEGLVLLQPMGFINLNTVPQFLNWKTEEPFTVGIGSATGEVYEAKLPGRVTEEQNFLSYRLTEIVTIKSFRFVSIKSRIRRDLKREKIKRRKDKKRQRKLDEIEKLKAVNPGLQIDMATALADSEPEEEEEPLHIPAKPNPILWLKYVDKTTIWVNMGGYDAGYIYEVQFGAVEPVRSTLIADGDDCEIHSFLEIDDYLLFGLINGKIRISRCNPKDFRDLRDYRVFSMHDIFNGKIPKIFKSFDGNNIVSVGHDGNVFVYDWSGPKVVTGSGVAQLLKTIPSKSVEDIEDLKYPSLEQKKIQAEQKRQADAAAEHDRKILGRIGELQMKFNDILQQNRELPEELQIPHRDMLLDDRITKEIGDEMQAELDDVREDLAYNLEVAQVGKQKLYDYFLEILDHVPIRIMGIREKVECSSFRLEKLGPSFMALKAEIKQRLIKEASQRGPAEYKLAEEQEHSMPEPGVETFFFGRDPETIIPRFSKKMLRILRHYRGRKLHEIERVYEWEKLHRQKPDPNKNHPDDDRNIREAERTLGDYKLKIGANYEPKPSENLTHKAIDIVKCRERIYEIQKEFNDQLFELRDRKKEIYDYIHQQRKRLATLHKLMPERNHVHLEDIKEINMDLEYPEKNLIENFEPGCGIEIKDIIYLEKTMQDLLPKTSKTNDVEEYSTEEIEELDKYHSLGMHSVVTLPKREKLMALLDEMPKTTDPAYYEIDTDTQDLPPFMVERHYQWILRMISEQENMLIRIETRIKNFDIELQKIALKRLHYKFEVDFIKTNMIALNQELLILRDSEEIENKLLAKAEDAMRIRNNMQTNINLSNRQIDESRKVCDRISDQMSVIHVKFMSTTKGHKFFDFLRRIFKKKYKPPKLPKEGDGSSESSSDDESSSEDENADTKSIDSADMTTIRLDESHCPPGLERTMYDLAFKLRSDRHALEQTFIEQQRNIENKRRDVAALQKQMMFHEEVYDRENETLLSFRRKRQTELNKIKTSVVLKMSQLQHFREDEDFRDLSNAILFDAFKLNILKSRAETLKIESMETKRLHRINIMHLQRMERDIKFMRFETGRLEDAIKTAMLKRFGIVLNLNDLEEEVLRRHVFELETNAEMELHQIEKEIAQRKRELAECQESLTSEVNKNTCKLNVLLILQDEQNFLDEVLATQDKTLEKFFKPNTLQLDRDIERLMLVDKEQKQQIQCLEREICRISIEPMSLQVEVERDLPKDQVGDITELPAADDEQPEILGANAYSIRMIPSDYDIDRVIKIVVKYFVRHLTKHMSKDLIRKYSQKVGRYLSHAAYNFEGNLTDRIFDCLVQEVQILLPKKYMLHLSHTELRQMFQDVLVVFDYERTEVNTDSLIGVVFNNAMESLEQSNDVINKTQYILEKIFQQLVEVQSLEEFLSDDTQRALVTVLEGETVFDPKCINMERLVQHISEYARVNLLDTVMSIPVRRLGSSVQKELILRREGSYSTKCSIASESGTSRTSHH